MIFQGLVGVVGTLLSPLRSIISMSFRAVIMHVLKRAHCAKIFLIHRLHRNLAQRPQFSSSFSWHGSMRVYIFLSMTFPATNWDLTNLWHANLVCVNFLMGGLLNAVGSSKFWLKVGGGAGKKVTLIITIIKQVGKKNLFDFGFPASKSFALFPHTSWEPAKVWVLKFTCDYAESCSSSAAAAVSTFSKSPPKQRRRPNLVNHHK